MTIETVRNVLENGHFYVSGHAMKRMEERNISMEEIEDAILHGKIIEDYPNDFPFPSCLILNCLLRGKPLHIVVGVNVTEMQMHLVTAYRPDPARWSDDFERRV